MACHFSGCYCKELRPSRSKFSQGKCGSCGHLASEHGQIYADVSYGDNQIIAAPQQQQQQQPMNNQQLQYGDYDNQYQMQQQQNYDPYQQQQQQQPLQNQYESQMNMNQNPYGSQMNFNQQQQPQQQYGSQMNMNNQQNNDLYGNQPPMNAVYGAAGPQVNFGQNQQYGSQMNMNMNQPQMQQQQQQGIVYQSKSKYWNDQQSQQEFTMFMNQRMQQILGNNRFDHNVNQLCAAINATCDECLKAAKKPNYKYISHTLIIPNDSPYNMGDSKHWSLKTDVCMQVNVRSMYMTAILEAYCSAM